MNGLNYGIIIEGGQEKMDKLENFSMLSSICCTSMILSLILTIVFDELIFFIFEILFALLCFIIMLITLAKIFNKKNDNK